MSICILKHIIPKNRLHYICLFVIGIMPLIQYLLILCIRMLICTSNKNYELLSKILPTWSILICMYVYQNKMCTYIHN